MIELNIVEASWSMDAAGSWLKLRPELPGKARMVAGELDPQKKYTVTIKGFRKKRSLDANRYLWVLCNKLSVKVGAPPEEIYRHYIPDVGDNSDTICIPDAAVKRFREGWEHDGERCIVCLRPGNPWCHFIPRSQGGLGIEQNIVTLCNKCHEDFDQTEKRKHMQAYIRHYLKMKYPDWDETKLIYKKGT